MERSLTTLPFIFIAIVIFIMVNQTPTFAIQPSNYTPHFSYPSLTTHYKPVQACNQAPIGFAHCLAIKLEGIAPHTIANNLAAYTPVDLQKAYKLPSLTAGKGKTVAIVDAYDNPNAEADLAVYRSAFGLPACTTDNKCFSKVNQQGSSASYPNADPNWAGEIALDLDMVSAICPNCHILLVEATSASLTDLGQSVNMAVQMGATAVSNSYGGTEDAWSALAGASYYSHAGVAITVSSGDSGYGVELPAAFKTVIAVGGTSLLPAKNSRGWAETAWNGTGSGCSQYINKPSWQKDKGCNKRTIADVAAVADPNTGVAVYNTYQSDGSWFIYGGTSVSSPIVASVYALAGNAAKINPGAYLYSHSTNLFDITKGSNGSCKIAYLCKAGTGYDGPTGLGTPNGIGAF